MRKILFAAASVLLLSSVVQATKHHENDPIDDDLTYPYVQWSKTTIHEFIEHPNMTKPHKLAEDVKSVIYGSQGELLASRLFIIRKDGMTTRLLLKNVDKFQYDMDTF